MGSYDFGERLRILRKKRDLTQPEMAELIGLSLRFYQDVEQGRKDPSFQKFQEILGRLKMSYAEFFDEKSTSEGLPNTVAEMTPRELENLVSRASKRDGSINIEIQRLKKINADLEAKLKKYDEAISAWDLADSAIRALFLYLVRKPSPMDRVPREILDPILKKIRNLEIQRRPKVPREGQ